ncbi:MAG: hypothetical protein WBP93_01660 [Pyrinomonadaceae bacterium]
MPSEQRPQSAPKAKLSNAPASLAAASDCRNRPQSVAERDDKNYLPVL